MDKLRLEDISKATELIIEKLNSLEKKLAVLKTHFEPKESIELMTRKETADFFKIDSTTLWNWTNKGKVTAYGIGARVYYKRSELNESLIKIN